MLEVVNALDFQVLAAVQNASGPLFNQAMLGITYLGNPVIWITVAAVLHWLGRERISFNLMNLVLFSSLAAGALKLFFATPRPSLENFKIIARDTFTGFSFPSGHATVAAANWSFLRKKWGEFGNIGLGIVALLVALSRLVLGAHFPSDVIAGLVLGIIIGQFLLWLNKRARNAHFHPSKLVESIAIAAILAVGIAGLAVLQSFPLAAVLLGYYAGFFMLKEMGLEQKRIALKQGALKIGVGAAGSAILLLPSYSWIIAMDGGVSLLQVASLGATGLWASFGLPFLWGLGKRGKRQTIML